MKSQFDEIIDFRQFFFKILKNWYLFVFSLLITLIVAFGVNRYTHERYYSETSILIKEENSVLTASDLLYEKSLSSKQKSLENKTHFLRSYPLIYKTIEQLKFDVSYYLVGNVMVSETFSAPIAVETAVTANLIGKSIIIEVLDNSSFLLTDEKTDKTYTYKFGESFSFYNTDITIVINTDFKFSGSTDDIPHTVVKFKSLKSLALFYQNKIEINQPDRESTVINISILEEDQLKGVTFLNKLTENYIKAEIEEKNIASINTVNFINDQLQEMSDSLSLIETQIQEYKNNNKITDLSLKAQSIYTNIVTIETDLAKSKSLNSYYNYLNDYIDNGKELEGVSVPTSFGVDDVGLNLLIKQLVEIQIKKNILEDGGQVNNPAIAQYNRQTKQLLLNLKDL